MARLTSAYHSAEDVRIGAVVTPELKPGDIQRHIFSVHLVECAGDATIDDRPKALNCFGVDRADRVLMLLVLYSNARVFHKAVVCAAFIRRQQAGFIRNNFAHEHLSVFCCNGFQHSRNHVTLTLHGAQAKMPGFALAVLGVLLLLLRTA